MARCSRAHGFSGGIVFYHLFHSLVAIAKMNRTALLMLQLNDILGPATAMTPRWQHRVRTSPALVESVLAEVKMLKQESRIRLSPAAAAEDLFKRLSEQSEQVVEKSA